MADEVKELPHTNASTGEVIHDTVAGEEIVTEHKTTDGRPTMFVKVYAPFKIYFEGEALSISALNETGPFDILPRHHNFICMLIACELVIQTPFDTQKIKISRALMHVKAEKVTVFVDV